MRSDAISVHDLVGRRPLINESSILVTWTTLQRARKRHNATQKFACQILTMSRNSRSDSVLKHMAYLRSSNLHGRRQTTLVTAIRSMQGACHCSFCNALWDHQWQKPQFQQ
eukprot:1479558-Amphidinium_carterae.1